MMAKPIKTLELHYLMIQFLIILVMWVRRYPKHGDTQINLTAAVAIFNQEDHETTKPLRTRKQKKHGAHETKKPKKPRNQETKKPTKPRNLWNQEDHETMKPLKPRNPWNHETTED